MLKRNAYFLLVSLLAVLSEALYSVEVDAMGYILEGGKNITWNDEWKNDGNAVRLEIESEVCELLSTSLDSASNLHGNTMNCTLVNLFGHPVRGYVIITFNNIQKRESEKIEAALKRLYHYFEKTTTLRNKKQSGPVVGNVSRHIVTANPEGNAVIIFGMEVYENGRFSEWRSDYNNSSTLRKLEDSICPPFYDANWGSRLTRDALPGCTVVGPSHRFPVGHYLVQFIRKNKDGIKLPNGVLATRTENETVYNLDVKIVRPHVTEIVATTINSYTHRTTEEYTPELFIN